MVIIEDETIGLKCSRLRSHERSVGNPHIPAVYYVIIPSLLLMIFALIGALIAVSTIHAAVIADHNIAWEPVMNCKHHKLSDGAYSFGDGEYEFEGKRMPKNFIPRGQTKGLASCNLNHEKLKNTVHSPEVSSTDDVPETKSQYCAPCVLCEEDWIWYRGKCYYFSNDGDTWENSQNFCSSHNASLALIDTQHELDVLLQFKGSRNHWIGLSRTDDNTAWTWTNGTLYNESLFKITRSSHKNAECVYLNREDVKSQEGTIPFKWICKKS